MRTYNRATVIGHVGNDVVMRKTQGGISVVNPLVNSLTILMPVSRCSGPPEAAVDLTY